ncbi:MAG: hypothetical protein AB1760_10175 [Pseudomonadota bacterium]
MTAPLQPHANPVRRGGAFRSGRVIQVRFTGFARLTGRHALWTHFGATPDATLSEIVAALGVAPDALDPRAQQLGDVALLLRMPADLPTEYRPGTLQPVAFVEGLAQHEIADALDWLGRSAKAA